MTITGKEEDWLGARNFCRQRCMDAVSVETSPENEWIKQRIVDGKVSRIIYQSLNENKKKKFKNLYELSDPKQNSKRI